MRKVTSDGTRIPVGKELIVELVGNQIYVKGYLDSSNMRRVLAAMHNVVAERGYLDIELNFSACTRAGSGSMLGISAQVGKYLVDGVDTSLVLPDDEKLSRLFVNTNWAHHIDFRAYGESTFKGPHNIPAVRFRDGDEQYAAVSSILDVLLGALSGFDRSHFRAIEWSLNEITDNVINHAESPIGGFVQLTSFPKAGAIQITVCDAGVGIPMTLRMGHPELTTDQEALDRAIREGITRDSAVGQGNGLYGSWRIARQSGGNFFINSGYANLVSTEKLQLHVGKESIPFSGSLVAIRIDYRTPISLEDALQFKGRPHTPVDHIDLKYEVDETGSIPFRLTEETRAFGTRAAGAAVRTKLQNLGRLGEGKKIIVDFDGIDLVSSSFADEVFGKLFLELGPMDFANQFDFRNIDSLVRGLIDRAISQRVAQ